MNQNSLRSSGMGKGFLWVTLKKPRNKNEKQRLENMTEKDKNALPSHQIGKHTKSKLGNLGKSPKKCKRAVKSMKEVSAFTSDPIWKLLRDTPFCGQTGY